MHCVYDDSTEQETALTAVFYKQKKKRKKKLIAQSPISKGELSVWCSSMNTQSPLVWLFIPGCFDTQMPGYYNQSHKTWLCTCTSAHITAKQQNYTRHYENSDILFVLHNLMSQLPFYNHMYLWIFTITNNANSIYSKKLQKYYNDHTVTMDIEEPLFKCYTPFTLDQSDYL